MSEREREAKERRERREREVKERRDRRERESHMYRERLGPPEREVRQNKVIAT